MSPRALRNLGLAFAALLCCWAAVGLRQRRAERPVPLFSSAAEARRLSLSGAGGSVALERDGEAWRLVKPFPYPADPEKVRGLLQTLAKARLSAPLGDDPERYPLFGVTEASGVRVTAETASGARLDAVVGYTGGGDGAFVLPAGSREVREAAGLERWRVDEKPGAWADRAAAAVNVARLARVQLGTPKGRLALVQGPSGWALEGAKAPLSPEARKRLDPLLTSLGRLEADEVEAAGGRVPPVKPEVEVLAEGVKPAGDSTETVLRLRAGPLGKDYKHEVWVDGKDGVVFRMSGWRLDPFRLKTADLGR